MLKEIYCEQFYQKHITFNEVLNVVLGTSAADNSIGKSTFLLIIDFVYGGNTYAKAIDIKENVGNHDIFLHLNLRINYLNFVGIILIRVLCQNVMKITRK